MSSQFELGADVSKGQQALKAVADDVRKVGDAAAAASADMDAAFDHANRIQDMKEQIGDLTEALQKAENQAKETNAELGNPGAGKSGGDGAAKWTAIFSGIGAGLQILQQMGPVVVAVRETIKQLADDGNENFGRLETAIDNLSSSWDDLKSNLASSESSGLLTSGLTAVIETASGAAENVDILGESYALQAAKVAESVASMAGWRTAANLAGAAQARLTAELEKGAEAQEEDRKQRQMDSVGSMRAKLDEQRAAQRDADALKEIKSTEEITAKIDEQFSAMEALAKQGALNSKERQEATKKLQDLERRRLEIIREVAAEQRKQADLAIQLTEKENAEKKRLYEEDLANKKQSLAKQTALNEQRIKDEIERNRQATQEYWEEVNGLADQQGTKDVAAQIKTQAGSDEAIIKRLAANAGEVGSDAYRQAHRQATMQARGGAKVFSDEEVAAAQQQNAQAIIGSLRDTGQVGDKMVDALGQVVGATGQLEQKQAQQDQRIDSIMQVLGDTMKNTRTRAQTQGRKQI